ncbi:hypothetical protein EMIHUDRAFT_449520, partial [Emiliania huxleyi CCMP1516]|uniref:Uncharacterized protein n=2 Tax=Emiliania huxleyi TaxID=2903 RepID=A0A0D3K8M8_EMIH1
MRHLRALHPEPSPSTPHSTHLHEASLLPKRSIPLAYSKLPALVQAHAQSTATWLWWVDCDTAILDERRPLSDVLAAALTAAAESGDTANGVASDDGGRRWRPAIAAGTRAAATPELLIAYEPWGVDSRIEEPEEPSPKRSIHELVRKRRGAVAAAQARLGHPINTGSFFLRRGPWAAALLRRWRAAPLWDQSALQRLPDFAPPPLGHTGPYHVGAGGAGVALPHAPFNEQLCASAASPPSLLCSPPHGSNGCARPAPFLLHLSRGRSSLGRCSPDWVQGIPPEYKSWLREAAAPAGLGFAALRLACCNKFPLRGQLARRVEGALGVQDSEVWARVGAAV